MAKYYDTLVSCARENLYNLLQNYWKENISIQEFNTFIKDMSFDSQEVKESGFYEYEYDPWASGPA